MDVAEIKDRINDDVQEIISHYVDLKQQGRNFVGVCPFHNEKSGSFTVSPGKGMFKCFGCGVGGDSIKFIMDYEHVDFKEAILIGARKLNIDFEWPKANDFNQDEFNKKESILIVLNRAADYFQDSLTKNLVALNYVKDRNFILNQDDPFLIGYAPAGNTLLEWSKKNAISQELLTEAGLTGINNTNQPYDFFRDRIIFPICDKNGRIIAFTGRYIGPNPETAKKSKYLNSPNTLVFVKGETLFGLNLAKQRIRAENRAYLVEGNFDVKRMHDIGVTNTVAPCGTSFTVEQAKLLKTFTKNVTLIYDGDPAGKKATDTNAKILIGQKFNVSVISIPDHEDPDSLFKNIETFENFKDTHQTDYILYNVMAGANLCKNPAFKSEFIREVASLIATYDEPSLHEVYIESVSQIIKPKKAWQDYVRALVSEKPSEELPKTSIIPRNVSASDYQEYGFYADNNQYFFADSKGVPKIHSNFVLVPLFHIESTINAKRLYEVKNVKGQVRVIEIPQRDLVSLTAFMVHIESLGNFWFDGSQADLNRLKRFLYEKTESCTEISQLGWQKDGFFAWGNGIFNTEFVPVDSYGIVRHNKRSYYIPAFSSIYEKEDNLYKFERKFIHMQGNITLKEYVKKYVTVFGLNAKIGLCFYFASVFRDIINTRMGIFPILNMFGPKGAGKTAAAESLVQFFGRLSKAPNLHNTSKAALADHVASSVNAIAHMDEYRNDLEMEKREFIKGLWDGNGRSRMNMDKDKKREMTSVDQAVIITGQQMATADIALFSRFIFLSFTQIEYSDDERNAFISLKETEKRGLTHLTHQLLKLRGFFKDHFVRIFEQTAERMRFFLDEHVVEDRIFNNWLIILGSYCTLSDHLELPWSTEDLLSNAVDLMVLQNKETKKNDDLGNFWKVIQFLISSNLLYEDGDYKMVTSDKITRRYIQKQEWKTEVLQYDCEMQFFYITTSRIFSLYKSQCIREGDKPLPESTVEYYLRNSPAFICETKKESFKKIDPKTGVQEYGENGSKKRTSTTALVFNNKMLNMSVSTQKEETDLSDSEMSGLINEKTLYNPEPTLPF